MRLEASLPTLPSDAAQDTIPLSESEPKLSPAPMRRRLALLAATSLVGPMIWVIQDLRNRPVNTILVATVSALLFLLVLTRVNQFVSVLTSALSSLERAMSRERVLRNAAVALVTTSDRDQMYAVAIDAVNTLLRGTTPITIRLVVVSDDDLTVVAASGGSPSAQSSVRISCQSLPVDVWQALLARQAITARPSQQPAVWRTLGFTPQTTAIFVTPLFIQQQLRGAIMVANCREFSAEIRQSLEVLGAQVALALESATLAESLAQRRSEERFRSLVQNASDMIAVVDASGTLCYGSPSLERILGYHPEELVGVNCLSLVCSDDRALTEAFLTTLLETSGPSMPVECKMQRRSGPWLDVEMIGNNLLYDPNVNGIVLTIRDVSERKSFEDLLYQQIFYDALTHLPNRPLFLDRLQHALARSARQYPAAPIGVLFLDLDGFKVINDSLSHETGDELLVAVAERLQSSLRPQDTLARFGGDEFAILLDDLAHETDALHIADRIIQQLEQPFTINEREMFITSSIGIALTASGTEQPADLLRYADAAMYRAKHAGKARYEIFDISMNAAALERLELEQDLRRALDRREFSVHYQPLVKLATGAIVGVEALVRWQHPQRGMVSPALFIPCAEETGLILAIGEWVLEEACRQVQQWQQSYGGAEPLEISVNLSARQFQAANLVQTVAAVLERTGLPPTSLTLEITESVVMSDALSTIRKLRELKQLGVQLAVDDFGTGYSSLSYLKRFPVDTLKIDRAFVAGLGQNAEDTAIVQAVNTLAHTLGLSVTAEGVETAAVAVHLKQLGCDLGQGYYFARPLTSDLVETLLAQGWAQPQTSATVA